MKKLLTIILLACIVQTANAKYCDEKIQFIVSPELPIQPQLKLCSDRNLACVIKNTITITETLFLWGDSCLTGGGELVFDIENIPAPFLLNIGISGKNDGDNHLEAPFTGEISGLTFTINSTSKEVGRVVFFWRTHDAKILNNTFNMGVSYYSATSSGNKSHWLTWIPNYIRKNITISNNRIYANGLNIGNEGFGLGFFDGVLISNNVIVGVGDDPIAVHYSENVKILNNIAESIDGRIFSSNSLNVEIAYNTHTRIASLKDGKFYTGIALIYAGFEIVTTNNFRAPENYNIHHNYLYYSPGSIDIGGAIKLSGVRDTLVEFNYIEGNANHPAVAIQVLPQRISGVWTDPTGLDPTNVARIYNTTINSNVATSQRMEMTGMCVEFVDPPVLNQNTAIGYNFFCDAPMSNNKVSAK